jgi:hypothetical protein
MIAQINFHSDEVIKLMDISNPDIHFGLRSQLQSMNLCCISSVYSYELTGMLAIVLCASRTTDQAELLK